MVASCVPLKLVMTLSGKLQIGVSPAPQLPSICVIRRIFSSAFVLGDCAVCSKYGYVFVK